MYLEPDKRPLSNSERRLLSAKARDLRSQERAPRKILLLTWGFLTVLWLATILASDAPWTVVTLVWITVGCGISFWIWRDAKRDSWYAVAMAERLKSAVLQDEANVYAFEARSFVEFEEAEDEGACYAFDVGRGRIAFVVGQEFYPEACFPSLDFSLVYPLDAEGNEVDMLIEKRGPKAEPVRKIARRAKADFVIPDHLEVLEGELGELERLLIRQHGA